MMIKLAKNAEAKAKLQPKKPGGKTSISLPEKWIYIVFVALLAFQVYLNIAAYYAVLAGMKNYSLFIIGIIMLVFAGMFHLFRYGRALAKTPSPKIITAPPKDTRPIISPPSAAPPLTTQSKEEKPLVTPSSQKSLGTSTPQRQSSSQSTISEPAVTRGDNSRISTASAPSIHVSEPTIDENNIRNTLKTKSNVVTSDEEFSRNNSTDNERRKM
jgi:ubiquinol-cytochrome c reductase cytochrome b subunit